MAKDAVGQGMLVKGMKERAQNDMELLKLILDKNPELKKRVLLFMQKNYSKIAQKAAK